MQWDSQNAAVLVIVAIAMIYVISRAVKLVRNKSGGCGSCSACPTKKTEQEPELIALNTKFDGPIKTDSIDQCR